MAPSLALTKSEAKFALQAPKPEMEEEGLVSCRAIRMGCAKICKVLPLFLTCMRKPSVSTAWAV